MLWSSLGLEALSNHASTNCTEFAFSDRSTMARGAAMLSSLGLEALSNHASTNRSEVAFHDGSTGYTTLPVSWAVSLDSYSTDIHDSRQTQQAKPWCMVVVFHCFCFSPWRVEHNPCLTPHILVFMNCFVFCFSQWSSAWRITCLSSLTPKESRKDYNIFN